MPGTIYLVATPIGNLADMSFRAVETLQSVDLIACEDTRHSRKLLAHYGVSKKLVSYHGHNEYDRSVEIVGKVLEGISAAIISDAGTPAINDPGHIIVRKAIEAGIDVVSIPGAAAFVNAVIVSGLPTDSIFFGGFLPSKKGERLKRLAEVREIPATLVFYESPHRLARSIADCVEALGDRQAAVVREITKLHEETVRGTLKPLAEQFAAARAKGEFVLVIDRAGAAESSNRSTGSIVERVIELEMSGMDQKAALKTAAKEFGLSRSEAYRQLQLARR